MVKNIRPRPQAGKWPSGPQSVWLQSLCSAHDLIWAEWVCWDPLELVGLELPLPPEQVRL